MTQEIFNKLFQFNILWIPNKSEYIKIFQHDIIYIEADGNYCKVNTIKKTYNNMIFTIQIGKIESQLNKSIFIRIHRSYIINIVQIESVSLVNLTCKLHNSEKLIPIGKEYEVYFRNYFKAISSNINS